MKENSIEDVRMRLKEYFDKRQISASTFSGKIGKSRSTLLNFINGNTNGMGIDVLFTIGQMLPDLDYQWLLRGKHKLPSSPVAIMVDVDHEPLVTLLDDPQQLNPYELQEPPISYNRKAMRLPFEQFGKKAHYCFKVKSNNMFPSVAYGDYLVCVFEELSYTVSEDSIWVIVNNTGYHIGRLKKISNESVFLLDETGIATEIPKEEIVSTWVMRCLFSFSEKAKRNHVQDALTRLENKVDRLIELIQK
jgi:hypothetical protein